MPSWPLIFLDCVPLLPATLAAPIRLPTSLLLSLSIIQPPTSGCPFLSLFFLNNKAICCCHPCVRNNSNITENKSDAVVQAAWKNARTRILFYLKSMSYDFCWFLESFVMRIFPKTLTLHVRYISHGDGLISYIGSAVKERS